MKMPDIPIIARRVLLTGIVLSVALMTLGVVMVFLHPADIQPNSDIAFYMESLRHLQPAGIFFLGLAVLALSPLLGVLAQAVIFWRRREYLYAVTALLIFLVALSTFFFHQ